MIGDNSIDDSLLKALFDQIVTAETQRRERVDDLKELYVKAKSDGFDVGAIRENVKAYFLDQEKKRKLAARHDMAALYAGVLQLELF